MDDEDKITEDEKEFILRINFVYYDVKELVELSEINVAIIPNPESDYWKRMTSNHRMN